MNISIVRGAFLNPFELQNFYPLKKEFNIQAISSLYPLNEQIDLPLLKLPSPTDLPNFPYKLPILNRIFTDAHYLLGLEKKISGNDIVHVAETYYHYTIQAIKAKQKGLVKKIISTCWDVIPHNNEGIHGRKKFKQLSYKYIDHFITPTKVAKDVLIKEGVSPRKISIIPVGINLQKFHPLPQKPTNNMLNILFVGRLTREKGLDNLLLAFNKLKQEFKNIKISLIGDGYLKKDISDKKIHIKQVSYSKIHIEYQKADIFCLPTKQEQYGMALIEAMASALPIVTTNLNTLKEVCGNAALYSPINNPKSIYSNLHKLIQSKSLRHQLSQKAFIRAQSKYDYRQSAVKIRSTWLKVTKNLI
jgi:glycosyltransferase involved in cell wall biosynthesis